MNITKQIALVLFVPLLGALSVIWMFYYYLEDTASDAAFINIAGHQRKLSEQIRHSIELVLRGEVSQKIALKTQVKSFDHALNVLINGGSAMGYELPPADTGMQRNLIDIREDWEVVKPAILSLTNEHVSPSKLKMLYAEIEEYIHQLTGLSNKVVASYAENSNRLNRMFINRVSAIAVLDLLLLLIGIGVMRRYEREQKNHSLQLENESTKQEALRSIINITLQPLTLSEQLERVLDILFKVPILKMKSKGCIFLIDGNSNKYTMAACQDAYQDLLDGCESIPLGQCICGKADEIQESFACSFCDPEFKDENGILDNNAHISMPIVSGDILRGVLNLYVDNKNELGQSEYGFLQAVTEIVASIISSYRNNEVKETQAGIINDIYDAVASTDMEGIVTSWNRGAEKMFGYKADEMLGRSILDAFPNSSGFDVQKKIIEPLLVKKMQDLEMILYHKNGESFYAGMSWSLHKDKDKKPVGITLYCRDISLRKFAERELKSRVKQQTAIAELGRHALQNITLSELMDRMVGLIAGTLQVEFCKVLELSPDGEALKMKAGEGWSEELIGNICVVVAENSQAGYTLRSKGAVIVDDLLSENRFSGPQFLLDHGIVSGISVEIQGQDRPYGVLGAHSSQYRKFTSDDVNFLQAAANILSEAIKRHRAERHVARSEARFRNLVETSSDWIWEVNEHAIYTYASPRIKEILGYTPEEVIGKTPFELMPPDEAERVAVLFSSLVQSHSPIMALENTNQHKKGYLVVLETSGVPIYDEDGKFKGYRGIDRDITDRKKDEQHLEQLAHYDFLTGLPNRALFFDRLQQSLARAPWRKRSVAVMFLDLDRFKVINDTLGHDAGDKLLAEVAKRLSGFVRDGDTVARIGGDEFAIILDDVAASSDVLKVAQSIHFSLEEPVKIRGQELFTTTSIGISCFPEDGEDSKLLVSRADIAMYHAKAQGRNNFQFYSDSMDSMAEDRLNIETRLRHALDGEEYHLHYQPKMDLASGRLCGMEALVRWMEPKGGLMPPCKFIPLLEDTGLIVSVGEWILRTSCEQTKRWQEAGYPELSVSVNLSARQFKQGDLEEMIVRVLRELNFDPKYLELEITESILMENVAETTRTLNNLHDHGIRIVIDDFGTGYSSLSYLKQFPISVLKIDRSFVSGVSENEEDSTLTLAIIAMAQSLGIRIVAEGAETREQVDFLKASACNEIQGYYYSKPLTTEDMTVFLQDNYYPDKQVQEIVAG